MRFALISCGLLLASSLGQAVAKPVQLPDSVGIPEQRPPISAPETQKAEPPAETPVAAAPIPAARPETIPLGYAPATPTPGNNPIARTVPPELSGPKGAMPIDEVACRAQLKKLGVEFKEADPQISAAGCSMPYPVSLKSLGSGVSVAPEVTINCETALVSAIFVKDKIVKVAKAELGAEVRSIAQASGYVCRPRNGTNKLSEHAFGNALDIASFTLDDGKRVDVKPTPAASPEGKFLNGVRDAACGPYKTVLGPGSNADHEFHFRFDLAQRRNGSAYCR